MNNYTLITNLSYVILPSVRTFCHALLLEEGPAGFLSGMKGTRRQMRGFGPNGAWPVFDIDVSSIEFTLVDAMSQDMIMSHDGSIRPLSTGAIMKLKDGPELSLLVSDHEQSISIERFKDDITEVWQHLPQKVAQFWRAPYFPVLRYVPVEHVRSGRVPTGG
jgi:hypothetical protein